jgi:hypothetical protein
VRSSSSPTCWSFVTTSTRRSSRKLLVEARRRSSRGRAASACSGSASSSALSALAALCRQELRADGQQERMRLGKRKRKNRAVRGEWLQSATNTVRHVLVFRRVCSYHGVYSFVFVKSYTNGK